MRTAFEHGLFVLISCNQTELKSFSPRPVTIRYHRRLGKVLCVQSNAEALYYHQIKLEHKSWLYLAKIVIIDAIYITNNYNCMITKSLLVQNPTRLRCTYKNDILYTFSLDIKLVYTKLAKT